MRGVEPERSPMRGRPAAWIARLLVPLALAGCASLASRLLEKPTIRFEAATLTGATREAAEITLDFQVTNPNRVSLPLGAIDYRLSVDGRPLLAGTKRERIDLAARAETAVSLPVTLRFRDLGSVLGDLLRGGNLVYEVDAEFVVLLPATGGVRIPVVHKGVLPLPAGFGLPSR